MCFTQKIHTAHHAALLVFDASAQQSHACHLVYPTTTDASLGMKCPLHSCCRISSELVFQCVAVQNGGSCLETAEEGEGEGNGAYEEVVYVPFERGEEPVWDAVAAGGGGGGSSPDTTPGGTKKAKQTWSWGSSSSSSKNDCDEEPVEVLWDAVAEGGDGLFWEEDDDDQENADGDGDGDGDGSEDKESGRGSDSSSRRSSARMSQYSSWSPIVSYCASSSTGSGSGSASAREETFSIGGDWDDEHAEEGEIPHMEFWSFDKPLPTPSFSSSSSGTFPSSPSSSVGVDGGIPLPSGKTVIYLEDPTDVLDMIVSELQLVGRFDPGAETDDDVGFGSDVEGGGDRDDGVDDDADSARVGVVDAGAASSPKRKKSPSKGQVRDQDEGKKGWFGKWWRREDSKEKGIEQYVV